MYFQSNVFLAANVKTGLAKQIPLSSFLDMATDRLSNAFRNKTSSWQMKNDLVVSHNQVVFYMFNSNKIEVIDLHSLSAYTINLPFDVASVLLPSDKKWLVQDMSRRKYILKKQTDSSPCPNVLQEVEESGDNHLQSGVFLSNNKTSLDRTVLSAALEQKIDSPNRVLVTDNTYASIAVGLPDLDSFNEVHYWPRQQRIRNLTPPIVMESGQIVRTVAPESIPDDILSKNEKHLRVAGYLEVVDTVSHKLRYMPVPE